MSVSFSADEVLAMAMRVERNGVVFYREAARRFGGEEEHQLLLRLSDMEAQHEATFAAMRAVLSEQEQEPTTFDPEGLAPAYLAAMADGYVFDMRADPKATLAGDESIEDVLRTAIAAEGDSVLFYLGLKEIVPPSLGTERVDEIIHEEMRHIVLLSNELRGRGL